MVGANAIARAPVALTMTVSPRHEVVGARPLMPPPDNVVIGQYQVADALSGDLVFHRVVAVCIRVHGGCERVVLLIHQLHVPVSWPAQKCTMS
jgi:hypothetical protein